MKAAQVAKAVWNEILGKQEFSHFVSVLHYYHRFKILTEKMEVLLFLVPPCLINSQRERGQR